MTDVPVTTRKDWATDQEVRWCPGCGDYSILTAMQLLMPEMGVRREDTVFVSGIGCAARFPYYMNTYGLHAIHGRSPAVATGLAMARGDLHVWVVGGDGDMMSIGGNHLIHALRRNVNLNILLFNNQIYGLTKGQYSPTSERGKVTKSTPHGSVEQPFNAVSLALGAEASFVARTHDMDRGHMQEMFRRAHDHPGAAFVEVFQNCNVFNDGAFAAITKRDARDSMLIDLKHGEPVRFGAGGELGVVVDRPIASAADLDDAVIGFVLVTDMTDRYSLVGNLYPGVVKSDAGVASLATAKSAHDRIQVFQKDGTFVDEMLVMPNTTGSGAAWDLDFSHDEDQAYMYLADGVNQRIHVIDRENLEHLTSFGDGGRQPGLFFAVHSIATDSQGNIFTTETYEGKRVQKFVYTGMGEVTQMNMGPAWPSGG